MNTLNLPCADTRPPGSGTLAKTSVARRLFIALMVWPVIAFAAIVTIADVAAAIMNSPNASAFMKAHATEIGSLAINVESHGDTTAYNGSCCYGVLQLNTSNIAAIGSSVSQYRYATLQEQINGWSQIQSQALSDPVIQQLQNMSTFDGQPVDAAMMIACVQLGQGNCRTMIKSGSCNGFHDSNGTTICSMAATMRAGMNGTAPPTGGGGSTGGGGAYAPGTSMAPDEAFAQGAGVPMGHVSDNIKLIVAAIFLTWLAWTANGSWTLFSNGRLAVPDLTQNIARAIVLVMLVIWLVN